MSPAPATLAAEEDLLDEVPEAVRSATAAELSEDPVRLYLREIGEVKLLDSDSEFRLATQIEAGPATGGLPPATCAEGKRHRHGGVSKPAGRSHHILETISRGRTAAEEGSAGPTE